MQGVHRQERFQLSLHIPPQKLQERRKTSPHRIFFQRSEIRASILQLDGSRRKIVCQQMIVREKTRRPSVSILKRMDLYELRMNPCSLFHRIGKCIVLHPIRKVLHGLPYLSRIRRNMTRTANIYGDIAIDPTDAARWDDSLMYILDDALRKRHLALHAVLDELPRLCMSAHLIQLPQRRFRRNDLVGKNHLRLDQRQGISFDGRGIMRELHKEILFPILLFKVAQFGEDRAKKSDLLFQGIQSPLTSFPCTLQKIKLYLPRFCFYRQKLPFSTLSTVSCRILWINTSVFCASGDLSTYSRLLSTKKCA